MQTIAILHRTYKSGPSVFRFVETENGELWMFGGNKPQSKKFANRKELNAAILGWKRLGFRSGMPKASTKPVAKPVAKTAAKPAVATPASSYNLSFYQACARNCGPKTQADVERINDMFVDK